MMIFGPFQFYPPISIDRSQMYGTKKNHYYHVSQLLFFYWSVWSYDFLFPSQVDLFRVYRSLIL